MKRILSWLLVMLIFLPCAGRTETEDWQWAVNSQGKAVIIAYTGSETDVTVPALLGGYPVETLYGFFGGENIVSLTLEEGIQRVEKQNAMKRLKSVVFPRSLHTIGENAFFYLYSLSSVRFCFH